MAKKGETRKGLLIRLQTVVVCAIAVACSITMEYFKCDPKVIRMALCDVQSLSHVTLIWCKVTTWDLYDLDWLSFLIWSVLSEIFKSMFKGSVQLCSLNPSPKVSFQWRAYTHMLTMSTIKPLTDSKDTVNVIYERVVYILNITF